MNDFLLESGASQIWKISEGDDFFDVKTRETLAKPTELSDNIIVFEIQGGDKYLMLNSLRMYVTILVQKKDGDNWITVPDDEILCVKPGAVIDLLNRNLETRMIHPGNNVDNKVINIKQDKTAHISRFDIQRKYDKLYVENELESDMQIAKEWTYPFLHSKDADTDTSMKPGKPKAAFGPRDVTKKVKFSNGSILEKCKKFGDELKAGKEFIIHAPIMNPVFDTALLPPRHGMQVKMSLGRDDSHNEFFEDYTVLAANTEASVYRFKLQKSGSNRVYCRYETGKLTTSAYEKYNQMFAGGKAVETAAFMVFNHHHRSVDKDATEIQGIELPNTSNVPVYTAWELKSKTDYNHFSTRDNWFDNSFLRLVKRMQFEGTSQANTGIREGTTTIDFDDKIDLEYLYKSQKRWMLGRELQSMSDQLPAMGILNGAMQEVYSNQGEDKSSFMKLKNERHTNPFILEFDQSHGKYGADQKHPSVANLAIKVSLKFREPMPENSEVIVTSAYRGKYIQQRATNGILDMNFLQVDVASTLL